MTLSSNFLLRTVPGSTSRTSSVERRSTSRWACRVVAEAAAVAEDAPPRRPVPAPFASTAALLKELMKVP